MTTASHSEMGTYSSYAFAYNDTEIEAILVEQEIKSLSNCQTVGEFRQNDSQSWKCSSYVSLKNKLSVVGQDPLGDISNLGNFSRTPSNSKETKYQDSYGMRPRNMISTSNEVARRWLEMGENQQWDAIAAASHGYPMLSSQDLAERLPIDGPNQCHLDNMDKSLLLPVRHHQSSSLSGVVASTFTDGSGINRNDVEEKPKSTTCSMTLATTGTTNDPPDSTDHGVLTVRSATRLRPRCNPAPTWSERAGTSGVPVCAFQRGTENNTNKGIGTVVPRPRPLQISPAEVAHNARHRLLYQF